MKTMRSFLVLFVSLALVAGLSAQTITGYGVGKVYNGTQTSDLIFNDGSAMPYGISAYVFGSGLLGTYSFTPASGTQSGIVKTLTTNATSGQFEEYFTSSANLNTAYGNNSAYSMAFPNNAGSGPQSATLPAFPLSDAYPDVPMITNLTWSGGMLQIDPTQNYTLTFTAFASFTSDDSYGLKIKDSLSIEVASGFWNTGGTTTFFIAAGTLTAGQIYDANLRFNNNFINYNTPFAGANGNTGFTISNDFQIQAIPEPSTYAEIFGVMALAGAMFHRRRRLA